ncbi:disulfide bond formation protein DsbA [Methylobacterium currus]|uniref:Disulfide bond formation protein DsbA n=1 Tax=Methylobacterium currus TaxID=2051553 RepID=A0A2R4WIR3_9HYPH|nr:DsbA family protein [Methylobacterium currus]AWB21406.1 disulfide bond formation protein DsbA [Methylobacterium currus]UHC13838.1 DsbA family protein [Methylobacterium currus]
MLLLPRLLPALALAGLVATAAPTRAQAPTTTPAAPGTAAQSPATSGAMTDAQRQAIESVVRDYLLKNPEVLQEAMAELEKRQQEAQKVAQASALKETRDTLHNSPHGFVAGNPNGDVTLVEFFDYNCGYCKRALTDLQTLIKGDPKLKVVLRDFPVLGPDSLEASKVALAAKQQLKGDKLFDYHTRLLESRGRVNGERAIAVAKEMGLDIAKLQKDMQAPDIQAALQENVGLGDKLGLSGTPAFIIGDEIIPGAVGVDPIRKTVAGVRQCGHATC